MEHRGVMFTLNTTEVHSVSYSPQEVELRNEMENEVIIENSSGNGITATLDSSYYKGQGMRTGEEREYIVENRAEDAVVFNGENVTSAVKKQNPKPGDPCHTLSTDSRNYVVRCIDEQQDGEGTDEPIAFNADVTTKVDMNGTAFSLRQKDYKDPQSIVFGISPYESNGMKSKNPHSGIYEAETSRTLDLNGGNPACNQGGMMVVDARGNGNGEIVPTLAGDHMNRVTDYTPITYQDKAGTSSPGAHPGSYNGQDAYNDMLVAAVDCWNGQDNGEINGTLQSRADRNLHANNTIRTESVVRRLTPLECERLQGFPDGWTDIGEWTDSKGKLHKESDSPRYKALGNSIALPFWFFLLRRISAQYERPATLGSLFDGIGGFPYCWEMCNGRGTALWASEIEEFPIAVTKKRFPEED